VKVLSSLPPQDDPRLLVGSSHFDDAGVLAVNDDLAIVQSTDFFPPVVDDPWWFGRIAAANALSDLYAMGATPLSVLNLVVFNNEDLPMSVLGEILAGAEDAVREAGAVTLGGHSVSDEGVKFGLAVTGTLRPGEQVTNGGARVGDRLYLTKALGTGCLTTAARKGKASESELEAAQRQMGALNAAAADAMKAVSVRGATDVTGFGLAGHGHEMAMASGVDLVLSAAALPLLDGARRLMDKGFASGGAARTQAHLGEALVVSDQVDKVTMNLATDSETSGGLLLAVPSGSARRLEEELAARDVLVCEIGCAEESSGAPQVRIEP
jgi:selenide, water dikinase